MVFKNSRGHWRRWFGRKHLSVSKCNFFPFVRNFHDQRPAAHTAKHTLGRGGHFICHPGVSYYGKNTKFTIKRFPSKPGGHFLEARRAFFCPRAAGVRNPDVKGPYICKKGPLERDRPSKILRRKESAITTDPAHFNHWGGGLVHKSHSNSGNRSIVT